MQSACFRRLVHHFGSDNLGMQEIDILVDKAGKIIG